MVIFTARQNLANLNEVKMNSIVKFANLAGKSYICFPAHFRPLFKFRKCTFNFVPDTLECANARFNFVFGQSILKHCHSISCFVTRFRQLQFKFVGHSS